MAPAGILVTVAVPSVILPAMLGVVLAMSPLVTPVTAFSVTFTTMHAMVSIVELLPFFATRPMTMPVGTFLTMRVAASIGTPVPTREASVALPLTASAAMA